MSNNIAFNLSSIVGLILVIFGVLILPLTLTLRQRFDLLKVIENILLASVYVTSGGILFLKGSQLDTTLLFGEFILIVATIYMSLKDLLRRS